MHMSRKTTRFLFTVMLGTLVFVLSACSLGSAPKKDIAVSQTAISLLYTQMAGTLAATPTFENLPTATATATVTPTIPVTPASPTTGPRPASYTLQIGEYPYCIARRFNVDPKELLTLNALSSGMIYCPRVDPVHPADRSPLPGHACPASPSRCLHTPGADDRLQGGMPVRRCGPAS